jgi:hypothetical protein
VLWSQRLKDTAWANASDDYEQRPARDAGRDARCSFDKRASSPAGSSRPLGTRLRRRRQRGVGSRFARAKQEPGRRPRRRSRVVRGERSAATSADVCSSPKAALSSRLERSMRTVARAAPRARVPRSDEDHSAAGSELVADRPPPEGRHFEQLSLGQLPMVCGAHHRCRRAGTTSRDSRSIDLSAVSTGIPLQNGRKRK